MHGAGEGIQHACDALPRTKHQSSDSVQGTTMESNLKRSVKSMNGSPSSKRWPEDSAVAAEAEDLRAASAPPAAGPQITAAQLVPAGRVDSMRADLQSGRGQAAQMHGTSRGGGANAWHRWDGVAEPLLTPTQVPTIPQSRSRILMLCQPREVCS